MVEVSENVYCEKGILTSQDANKAWLPTNTWGID